MENGKPQGFLGSFVGGDFAFWVLMVRGWWY
jgi:hypothetical protein